jgi:hypothetical protein
VPLLEPPIGERGAAVGSSAGRRARERSRRHRLRSTLSPAFDAARTRRFPVGGSSWGNARFFIVSAFEDSRGNEGAWLARSGRAVLAAISKAF